MGELKQSGINESGEIGSTLFPTIAGLMEYQGGTNIILIAFDKIKSKEEAKIFYKEYVDFLSYFAKNKNLSPIESATISISSSIGYYESIVSIKSSIKQLREFWIEVIKECNEELGLIIR